MEAFHTSGFSAGINFSDLKRKCPFKPLFWEDNWKLVAHYLQCSILYLLEKATRHLPVLNYELFKCWTWQRIYCFNYLEILCWQHFYHLTTEWRRRLSKASQHSTIQPTIHFTMETENDNTIPFLDTIGHKRFRRMSHYKCLQKIYAHWSVLVLWLTPPSISLTRCCQVLIWSLIKPPYIKGLSEPLCRCLQQHGITSVFTSDRTLRSHLGSCKSTKTRWSSV